MNAVTLADAHEQLSGLLDRVEAGESIDIIRHGRPVARLTAIVRPRTRVDAGLLRALTAAMPLQPQSAAELVRAMRDCDRA